ncbi:MAG: SpoVG family protein [Candidatus Omnitrophica bacterium]|nr:SpoVG family protein [Candidatus Omnitrophota bacterium]
MEITEIKILPKESPDKKLKAYVAVTFDHCFVVRNIKVIQGANGRLFIAMPSRKIKYPCPKCGFKNELRAKYCNQCGSVLNPPTSIPTDTGSQESQEVFHKDIAHPITQPFREYMQKRILEAYEQKIKSLGGSGYSR